MSRVSYFQRFSQRENHATNNTLLILRHFYQASPFKLEAILTSLLEQEFTVGLSFSQQVHGAASVPDALISQDAFRLFIEAKRGESLDVDQIKRHVQSIRVDRTRESHSGTEILLGLTKELISQQQLNACRKVAGAAGIVFASTTYSRVAQALRDSLAPHETDLAAMVADYETYLGEEKLAEARNRWLPIYPCGVSYAENKRLGLYYEPASRPSKANLRYIGIYANKAVSLVGVVESVVVVDWAKRNGRYQIELGSLDQGQKDRIRRAFEETEYYDLSDDVQRFYLVQEFNQTHLKKVSAGGVMGIRYLDLSEIIPEYESRMDLTSTKLANLLRDRVFQ